MFAVLRVVQGQLEALRMRNKQVQKWITETCINNMKTKVNNSHNTCILLLCIHTKNIRHKPAVVCSLEGYAGTVKGLKNAQQTRPKVQEKKHVFTR